MPMDTTALSAKYESAFDHFLYSYLTKRNLTPYEDFFAEAVCGFGTGMDEVFSNGDENWALIKRDLESAPNEVKYTMKHKVIKLVDPGCALVTAVIDLETEIMGQKIRFNDFRILVTLHDINGAVKLAGIHFSFPTDVHGEEEAYPLKELEERTQLLSRMVEQKTKSLQEAYRELESIINTDSVSGLYSRYYFEKSVKSEWERFNRFGRLYTLMMADVDKFKEINDTHGHVVGDEVLLAVGSVIQQQLRSFDVAARWGGDEFIILLPETTSDEALALAQRIIDHMEKQTWPTTNPVTMSFGITHVLPGESQKDVLKRVDSALHQAKKSGQNKVVVE